MCDCERRSSYSPGIQQNKWSPKWHCARRVCCYQRCQKKLRRSGWSHFIMLCVICDSRAMYHVCGSSMHYTYFSAKLSHCNAVRISADCVWVQKCTFRRSKQCLSCAGKCEVSYIRCQEQLMWAVHLGWKLFHVREGWWLMKLSHCFAHSTSVETL